MKPIMLTSYTKDQLESRIQDNMQRGYHLLTRGEYEREWDFGARKTKRFWAKMNKTI